MLLELLCLSVLILLGSLWTLYWTSPYLGQTIVINSGGVEQEMTIVEHDGNTLTIDRPFETAPDSASTFTIKEDKASE